MGISALDISNLISHWALLGALKNVLKFEFMQMKTEQEKDVWVTNKSTKAETVCQFI